MEGPAKATKRELRQVLDQISFSRLNTLNKDKEAFWRKKKRIPGKTLESI